MKLRVRLNRQTSRVEVLGEEPSLKELADHIKETVLPLHGLGAETQFSLSLNGSELLSDTGQTLSACGVVSGDLICVVLPEPAATAASASASASASSSASSANTRTSSTENQQTRQAAAMTSIQPGGGGGVSAVPTESEETADTLDPEPSSSGWEPMLCSEAEEGQAPPSLELLYRSAETASPSDAVMVAGHLLMLETGFVPQGCELQAALMPGGWRSVPGVYRLQYSHPLCDGGRAVVAAVSMGAVLVINVTLNVEQTVDLVRKLCLDASAYVTSAWPGQSAAAAFRDLKKLSRVFKDQLAYPLIAAAREAMALPAAFGLAALPYELLLRVLRLLDVCSVVRVSSVCRHLNLAAADSTLWRHLYRRDFRGSDPGGLRHTDWRELYKQLYKRRCAQRAARGIPVPPFYPRDIFNPAPLPTFPPLPGIIGGEYDQRPNLPRGLLPRPRHDPIHPPRNQDGRPLNDLRRAGPTGRRSVDVRRGFI
ncbi:F-box only protein 7 isoform X2 [Chaetodon trifascialis]|uniref:F-box only protein 7 isoform X2 n=1 Tax=Chaetodon trifascialis TaxID=109706 RepID=UPI0039954D21